jgi:hypothetical protein
MKKIVIIPLILLYTFCSAQNVGIGTTTPTGPLSFPSSSGNKIVLWGDGNTSHYGMGIQGGLFQLYTNLEADNIAFGFGRSDAFTERMRIINAGGDGLQLNGRILLKNGTAPLDLNYGGGVWMYKADNSALLGFMGVQNNQNIGFYGGPSGWGFTYDAINSRVGIGTSTPTSSLNVNGQLTIDQKNFGGYGGLLIKGNNQASNYPNIAFSIRNNAGAPADVVTAMIQSNLQNNTAGSESSDITFLTAQTGFASLSEKLRIRANGNVGIGNSNPNTPLAFPAVLGKKITLYPGTTGDVGFAVAGNRLQIYSDNPNADVAIGYDAAGTFNERFAVKPNGALALTGNTGQAGQVVTSNGGAAATWQSPTAAVFQNSVKKESQSSVQILQNATADVPDLTHSINLSGNALVLVNYNYSVFGLPCTFCGKSDFITKIYVDGVLQSSFVDYVDNVSWKNVSGSTLLSVSAGNHIIKISCNNIGTTISAGKVLSDINSQANFIVIPQ